MTKAVISGYYGFKNFGDETILSVLIQHIKPMIDNITVFSSDIDYTKNEYDVDSVHSFDLKNVIKTIKSCDILISGGGSLFQDVTGIKSLLYYAFVILLAILFKKKIIIFAQGIGPLKNKISKIIVKELFKCCDLVTVRDENSLKILKEWNIKGYLVCDPVFDIDIEAKEKKSVVGIQLRDFHTVNYNLLNKIALLINAKFADKKIKLFILQNDYDTDISRKFEADLKSINKDIDIEITENNIIENISELEYFIAMRYHAILTALKSGVKTCAINYDIKVEQLAKEAGIPLVSVFAQENFEGIYQSLINLDSKKLIEYTNSKKFDWSEFDKIILPSS